MRKEEIIWEDLVNSAPSSWWGTIMKWTFALLKLLHIRVFQLDGSKRKRRFLHLDLYQLRYVSTWKRGWVDLRYMDESGRLMVTRFKVSEWWGNIYLQETSKPVKPAKSTKGPATFKIADHGGSVLFWLGTVRRKVWAVGYNQTM
ncbi:hypothetical protein pETSU_262 [Edwardsiella phage pEt-SU]|uniref:Uncharacterized protein n=1 Tax=Edwardsiella phage pEt-SU TaxID=2562142 RepID=A0A4D6DWX8_9CAUD|nr:hypothetical protein HOV39_gp260 [Edwardsiella phage pEt-SU]QBZ70843.1 hypothetical protein pETSU_262 [Edwardsiella phage pEt-SU]